MTTPDDHTARRGTAILTACLVQTISESDPTFQGRFLDRLGQIYSELRDNSDEDRGHEMEMMNWTRSYLTGFSPITGQGDPLPAGA